MKKTKILLITILLFIGSNTYSQYQMWLTVDSLWEKIPEFDHYTLKYSLIECLDSNNFIAISHAGLNFNEFLDRQTHDGGKTWVTTLRNTSKDFLNWKKRRAISLSYPSLKSCLIVCDSSTFYLSNDSCKTWNSKIYSDSNYYCAQAQMLNDDFGVIISGKYNTSYTSVFITKDGAKTWTKSKMSINDSIINPFYYSSLNIINESIFYIFGFDKTYRNVLLKTINGGISWEVVNLFKEDTFKDLKFLKIKFFTEKMGYLGGYYQLDSKTQAIDYMFKTYDGGITWKQVLKHKDDYTKYSRFKDMSFPDSLNGAILSEGSRITYTTDGGISWRISNNWLLLSDVISVIACASPNFILAGSEDTGTLWRKYSYPITDIEVDEKETNSSISPNPASDYIEIQNVIQSEAKNLGIEIFNIFCTSIGSVTSTTTPPYGHPFELLGEKIKIDISNLPAGIYFIKIGNRFEKFVKM